MNSPDTLGFMKQHLPLTLHCIRSDVDSLAILELLSIIVCVCVCVCLASESTIWGNRVRATPHSMIISYQ